MRWLPSRWWFWAGSGFMLIAIVTGYLVIPVGNAILVHFDQHGIYHKTFLPNERERSFSEKLRRRIERRIRGIWR